VRDAQNGGALIADGRTVGVLTCLAGAALSRAFMAPVPAAEPSGSCFAWLEQVFDSAGMSRAKSTRELQRCVGSGASIARKTTVTGQGSLPTWKNKTESESGKKRVQYDFEVKIY